MKKKKLQLQRKTVQPLQAPRLGHAAGAGNGNGGGGGGGGNESLALEITCGCETRNGSRLNDLCVLTA